MIWVKGTRDREGRGSSRLTARTATFTVAAALGILVTISGAGGAGAAPAAAKEYVGTTDQHCPVFAVEAGECRADEELPFSFEVKGNSITGLQALVVEHCEGSEPPRLAAMEIPGPIRLRGEPERRTFVAGGNIRTALRRTGAIGFVRARVANGYLASLEDVGEDTYCYGRDIKWRATPR